MCSQSSEFEELVPFKSFGQADVVEVVKAINRVTKGVVILFFDQKVIVSIINSLDIELDDLGQYQPYSEALSTLHVEQR